MKTVLNSNKKVHDDVVENLIRSPQSFFDVTSVGEMMNKISNDFSLLDNAIIRNVNDIIERILTIVFIVAAATYLDKFFGILGVIGLLCNIWTVWYMKRTLIFIKERMLREKSVIFSHFSDTMPALTLIHNFRKVHAFNEEAKEKLNTLLKKSIFASQIDRALAFYLDTPISILMAIATISRVSKLNG